MKKLLLATFIMTSSVNFAYAQECQAAQVINLSADEEAQFAAATQRMIELTNPLKAMSENLFPAETLAQLSPAERDVVVKYLKHLEELLNKELTHEMFVNIYRKHFTLADINAMLEFYSSETGMKCFKLAPAITMECIQFFMPKIEPIINELNNELSILRYQQAEQAPQITEVTEA